MVDEIVIKLATRQVVLNRENADYLIDDNGLDWGDIPSKLGLTASYETYGSEISAIDTSEPRPIKIIGWVVGTESEMAQKKLRLSKIIIPNEQLDLFITSKTTNKTYTISGFLTKSLSFGKTKKTNNEAMCQFEFVLSAVYPFFEVSKSYTDLTDEDLIQNFGSIKVGARIVLKFSDAVENPYISFNGPRGSAGFIGFFMTASAGSTITIDTRKGKKYISTPFTNLNPISDWIEVPVSDITEQYTEIQTNSGVYVDIDFDESYTIMEDI